MAHLLDLKKELARFSRFYHHPKLPPLGLSGLYALFPEKYKKLPKEVTARWPDDDWPNGDKPGVYIFLDSKLNILYIGKTTMWRLLKQRLSAYFRYSKVQKRCKIPKDHGWSIQPDFVVTIGVPPRTAFEASAIEEYLINRLRPSENTVGMP
jgi:hypothetical protein